MGRRPANRTVRVHLTVINPARTFFSTPVFQVVCAAQRAIFTLHSLTKTWPVACSFAFLAQGVRADGLGGRERGGRGGVRSDKGVKRGSKGEHSAPTTRLENVNYLKD